MKDPAPIQPKKSKKVEIEMAPAWQKYANAILIPIIIGLAVYLLVRWRIQSNEAARLEERFRLTTARAQIHTLRSIDLGMMTQETVDAIRDSRYNDADKLITELLASTKDPVLRAEALVARGDLYWQVADFPTLPDATTRPTLNPPKPKAELLKLAEAAYKEVLAKHADQPLAVASARMGLAAIAQNHLQFDEAESLLKAVEEDPATPESIRAQAKIQRDLNKNIRTPLYIAPATQPSDEIEATTKPTTQPTTTQPTTQATQPVK
jgi:hypothetical protein